MAILVCAGLAALCGAPLMQQKLNGPLAVALVSDAQEVRLAFAGRTAVYLADQDADEVFELYASSLRGLPRRAPPPDATVEIR